MARETKEERELRRAAEEHAALITRENFKKSIPARLMNLQGMAYSCGVNTRVELTETGPSVEFTRYEYDDRGSSFEETLTYDSEEWQVEYVERRLREFKDEIDARAARRALAESTWKSLPVADRQAIKEFIACLM